MIRNTFHAIMFVLTAGFVLSLASSAIAIPLSSQALGPEPKVTQTQVAPGIYQFTVDRDGFVEGLNSVAVVNDQDVLVFDTDTRPSTAKVVLSKIRQITSKPVRFVVNSHWHPDHWSGNQVYADAFPGVEFISTEQTRTFMLNNAPVWPVVMPQRLDRQNKALEAEIAAGKDDSGTPLTAASRAADTSDVLRMRDMVSEIAKVRRVYPTLTYDHELIFRHGGREFRFLSVTGDAAASTALYLPNERILVAGDTVVYPMPSYTPPLSLQAASLRELLRLDFDTVIPGHGPVLHDKSYMILEAELFEEIVRQVTAAFRSGKVTVEQVQAAVNVDNFRARFAKGDPNVEASFGAYVNGMVLRAYLEGRDSKEFH